MPYLGILKNNLHLRLLLLRSPIRVNATGDAGYSLEFLSQRMKRLSVLLLAVLAGLSASAQTMVDDVKTWADEWKHAFSREGLQNWKPEFTARVYAGLLTEGTAMTGGVRIDDKRTVGLMVWQGNTWIDAAPANVYSLSTGLYVRRYSHLGTARAMSSLPPPGSLAYGSASGGMYTCSWDRPFRQIPSDSIWERDSKKQLFLARFLNVRYGLQDGVGGLPGIVPTVVEVPAAGVTGSGVTSSF